MNLIFARARQALRTAMAVLLLLLLGSHPPTVDAQVEACNPVAHPFCYHAQLIGCDDAKKVCGYNNAAGSPTGFVCACRTACTGNESCNDNEVCFSGHCNPAIACNSTAGCIADTGTNDTQCRDGWCVRGPRIDPAECRSDDQCRTGNPCGGAQTCDAGTRRCVTGAPVVCPQPEPTFEFVPDRGWTVQHRRAHCEPVAGSNRDTTCVTTIVPPEVNQCAAGPVDDPNLQWMAPGSAPDLRAFVFSMTLRNTGYRAGAKPENVVLRLAHANGRDALLATTADPGQKPGSGWRQDRKTGTWLWKAPGKGSALESVRLEPLSGKRGMVRIVVRGQGSFAGQAPKPPSPTDPGYVVQAGVVWSSRLSAHIVPVAQPCTAVVGNCQRAANGGLKCHVQGWKIKPG